MSTEILNDYASALLSDGDSRLQTDCESGLNKYLCPVRPAAGIVCASSCTASPIEQCGFDSAAGLFHRLAGASSARFRHLLLLEEARRIEEYLLNYFQARGLAEAILCPSGTDALLTAASLLAAEQRGAPMTAILPSASETGTGVPLAASGRAFDGPCQGQAMIDADIGTLEVGLRSPDGTLLPADRVDAAFAAAASRARGRAVVYLTYGTKTGLIAPHNPPADAEVIVDACQARIDPARVAAFLRLGWPVVVTGSKFFGGPAFSGAVLFPLARRGQSRTADPGAGTVLRWTAAVDSMQRFAAVAGQAASFMDRRSEAIRAAIESNPALVPFCGLHSAGPHWADRPSIVTFGVRGEGGMLSVAELRPIYQRLAQEGVLLGQPVGVGAFGGLRVAIGARDVFQPAPDAARQLLDAIRELGQEAVAGFAVAAE
jgi:hypothetical protein